MTLRSIHPKASDISGRLAPAAVVSALRGPALSGRTAVIGGLILLCFALGEAPLLYKFFVDLWQRPQYEFFPLLLLAMPFMAISCLRDMSAAAVRPGRWSVTIVLWTLAWAALASGAAMYWKWMAPLSTLLLGIGSVWALGGARLLQALMPVWVMLLLIIPPPGHFDNALLVALRQMAVNCSGELLNTLSVPLMIQGAVIEIPGHRLMVEEACSGINSMLAVLAFTVLLAFWKRLPTASLLLLLPVAFAYVFWANVLRITLCAFVRQRYDIDLLAGTVHELLGLTLFVGCMALVYSTEQVGQWLWNWDEQPAGPARDDDSLAASSRMDHSHTWRPWVAAGMAFVVSGAAVLARTGGAWSASTLPGAEAFDLPKSLAGWTRVERAAPESAEVSGKQSHLWQYRRAGRTVTVGMDYPFAGYHDATTCYGLAGWQITSTAEHPADTSGRRAYKVDMNKAPLSRGVMWFALCDESGRWWQRPAEIVGESRPREMLRVAHERALALPLVQVQVLSVGIEPQRADELAATEKLFAAAGDAISAQLRVRRWEREGPAAP